MRRRDGAARGATRDRIGDFAGGEPGPIPGRGTAEHPRQSVNARLCAQPPPNEAVMAHAANVMRSGPVEE